MKKAKRILCLVVSICLCLGVIAILNIKTNAASYYSEADVKNVKCTILSNSTNAGYVNTMMKNHILSSADSYRIGRNLKNGKSVVFFFDGCSDNVNSSTYGDYSKYHLSAYCAVVKEVNGALKVVFESENCSTIPDNPRNVNLNDGTAVPTVLDGVYNIISTNHLGRYASLRIADSSGSVPVIRCTSTKSYLSTSNAINIHARSNFSNAPTNGISSTSYSSTGCFNVGLTNNTWSEYNNFIKATLGIAKAIVSTPYSSGSWTKCTSGVDKGVVVVDRFQYKTQLAKIYGGDNSYTASNLVNKITNYTENLSFFNGKLSKPSKPTVSTARSQYVKGESVKISWTAVTGNTNYCINIYKNGTLIYEASLGTKTSYTLKSAAVGSYKIYVSANNSAGTSGTSSCTFKVSNPIKTCTSDSTVNLVLGDTDSKVIYAWTTGYYNGNTALFKDSSNTNISTQWGSWTNGKAPLTITAKKEGTTTLTVGVGVSETHEILHSMTITVKVTAKKYTVSYNANDGTGAPSSQTKKHGTALTLSTVKPTRSGYTFLGWATSGTATSASYKPGGSFTKNANTTLYAVWKKDSCTHKYGYKLVKEPTRSEKGSLLGTCSYCSAKTTVTLPKLNTTDYYYGKINASCTLYGKAVYRWETKEGQSFWFTEKIPEVGHQYTNACDTTCNVCNATRSTTHKYTNACDKTCNVCGKSRTVPAHKYSHACDTTCNVCNATRSITHKYTNSCDTTCNVCGAKRSITHKYKTTTTKATLKKNGSVVKKCTVCDKVASKMTVRYTKTIKLSTTSYTYNGKVKTPTVTVKDSAGKTLKKNTDYTVKYASGRKNVGTYKVTITFKGKYSGTKVLTFKIIPKAASVNKLTAKTKALSVKLNKQTTQTSGYQIQYATTKTFKSYKTATITSNKTTTRTISGLKAKTTYYVRVRTYKTVSGVKIYSNWSVAKSMKTK